MIATQNIIEMIKDSVQETNPNATVIIYGSYARGDFHPDSDVDVLILLDKERITLENEMKVKYPLYDIEFETGQIISPIVFTKNDWETRHRITPFYENIQKDGIIL